MRTFKKQKKEKKNIFISSQFKLLRYLIIICISHVFLLFLQDGYGDYALFFHDTYGGTVIGVLLKPAALEYKDFKVADVDCRKLNGDGKLVLNVSTMIEDFYVLGKGIIRAINVPSKGLSLTTSQAST